MTDSAVVTNSPILAALLAASRGTPSNPDGAEDTDIPDRATGALLGLAVGNVIGLPSEFYSYHETRDAYPNGVIEPDPAEARRPMDDDLAQAVDLAEALLSGGDCVADFERRIVRWLEDNGRGCGITTSEVVSQLARGVPVPEAARQVYESKGRIAPNGAVMRCAPVAIARLNDAERLITDSAAIATVTHYAPLCQWSCIVINAVIAQLIRGRQPDLAGILAAAQSDGSTDLAAKSRSDGIPSDTLDSIAAGVRSPADMTWMRRDHGLIGHTLLATQAGLWAAATPMEFEEAIVEVVSVGGDTDTNGAVAGAVLGARYGASAIPERWLSCVPERERIERLAVELLELS